MPFFFLYHVLMFCYSKLLAAQAMPKFTAGKDKQKSRLRKPCKPLPNAEVSGDKTWMPSDTTVKGQTMIHRHRNRDAVSSSKELQLYWYVTVMSLTEILLIKKKVENLGWLTQCHKNWHSAEETGEPKENLNLFSLLRRDFERHTNSFWDKNSQRLH